MKKCTRCFKYKDLNEYSKNYTFCKQCKREDYHNNPERAKRQVVAKMKKYHEDPVFREVYLLRRYLNDAWKYAYWKNNKIMKVLKVPNKQFFVNHISSLFEPGMNMNNYGGNKNNWQFDHIMPLNEANTVQEVRELFYYKNIRPCWRDENSKKRAKRMGIK